MISIFPLNKPQEKKSRSTRQPRLYHKKKHSSKNPKKKKTHKHKTPIPITDNVIQQNHTNSRKPIKTDKTNPVSKLMRLQ